MALRIISPTPPLEPASSSSTDSKYFNRERPAPALGGREGEGGGERGGEREGGRWGEGGGQEGREKRETTQSYCVIQQYMYNICNLGGGGGGGDPRVPPCINPSHAAHFFLHTVYMYMYTGIVLLVT